MNVIGMNIVGINLPFYPMRPHKGGKITRDNVKQLYADITSGQYLAQKKLNGDRACLGVVNGQVMITNRHGGILKHPVANQHDFEKLPSGTLLDGEVWKKGFYPFEALAIGGTSFLHERPFIREQEAIKTSKFLGHTWLFTPPTLEWLSLLEANLPTFEGVVMKAVNSPYIPLGSESQESSTWVKHKW